MAQAGVNSPLTSSCGRLFDAVAVLSGGRGEISYEGQAAVELTRAAANRTGAAYPCAIRERDGLFEADVLEMFREVGADVARGADMATVSRRFHQTMIEVFAALAGHARRTAGSDRVALSGGVFQNRLLADGLRARLENNGFTVITHRQVPPNDGGIALGQAVIGREWLLTGGH